MKPAKQNRFFNKAIDSESSSSDDSDSESSNDGAAF